MSNIFERKTQFYLLQAIREFFTRDGFLDVLTPPMVQNPGMEVHIHPFEVFSTVRKKSIQKYLHTSPEFCMKELLADGFEKIFTLSYCFRDEPDSITHRNQFIMLEWYRAYQRYEKIMDDCENLIKYSLNYLVDKKIEIEKSLLGSNFQRATVQEIFLEYLKIDILNFLDRTELRKLIEKDFKSIPVPRDQLLDWDDYYFLLFLNIIEPKLENVPYILLYEFPRDLAALSTIKETDGRVCERFEIYVKGIELCNCFNELCDLDAQKNRFIEQEVMKEKFYGYKLPESTVLYDALAKGLPQSAGIALGVERLLMSLTKIKNGFYF